MSKLGDLNVRFVYKGKSRVRTECIITDPNNPNLNVHSSVKRHIGDVQCKQTGRKRAFAKAMKQLALNNLVPRGQRTRVWDDFKSTINSDISNILDQRPQMRVVTEPIAANV